MKYTGNITEDDAIRGDVQTYEVCIDEEGNAKLKEVDTFYFMAGEELGDNVPVVPLKQNLRRLWKEAEQRDALEASRPMYLTSEERRAISPVRAAMHNAAEKMRDAYDMMCDIVSGRDIVDSMEKQVNAYTN